jgi:hypothetical protein
MEALQEYGRLEGRNLGFNPVDCSWRDVLQQLEMAEDAAAASERGDGKFLTRSRRKLSTLSKSIVPLLDALPDELCVLHGGLAIVFHVGDSRRSSLNGANSDIVACSKQRKN